MTKSIEIHNYYQVLQDLPDSYLPKFPEDSYIMIDVKDHNILIYYEAHNNTLHIIDLDLHSTDELAKLADYFAENDIHYKDLYDIAQSNILSENYNDQADYSTGFFLITEDDTLIYYEQISADWYAENLHLYDQNSTTKMLGFFVHHNINFI